jgi:hypothetical protein
VCLCAGVVLFENTKSARKEVALCLIKTHKSVEAKVLSLISAVDTGG